MNRELYICTATDCPDLLCKNHAKRLIPEESAKTTVCLPLYRNCREYINWSMSTEVEDGQKLQE